MSQLPQDKTNLEIFWDALQGKHVSDVELRDAMNFHGSDTTRAQIVLWRRKRWKPDIRCPVLSDASLAMFKAALRDILENKGRANGEDQEA